MPHKPLADWTDLPARKRAILSFLRDIQKIPEFRCRCLSSPEYIRQVFVDSYGMNVPGDVLLACVPEGDHDNGEFNQSGSMVFEVPPANATTDPQLIDFVRCTYVQWLTRSEMREDTVYEP